MGNALGSIVGGVGGFLLGGPAGAALGASLGGGLDSADAAQSAADTQADAAGQATAASERQYQQTRADQLRQYEQVRADQAPYRQAATPSLARMAAGTAPGGEYARSFGIADYQADPGYQFRLQQGEQGINRAASARGGQYSGATLKALANFNSGLASQEYGAAYSRFNTDRTSKFNREASLAGVGQTANTAVGNAGTSAYSTIAQAGQNNANQTGQNLQNAGEARASGYVGSSNAIGSGIKQAYDSYQQNQALNNMGGSGIYETGGSAMGGYFPDELRGGR
jgi:hypothetical protein